MRSPSPPSEMTCCFLIQLVFCKKKKLCGLLVLKKSNRRVHPLLKKILDQPLLSNTNVLTLENTSLKYLSPLFTEVHTDKNEFDPVFSRIW